MKRPITNLVIGCLAFLAVQLSAQSTTFTVDPQSVTAAVGEQFTVDITVTDFDDILSLQYSMNWNANNLEYVSLTNLTSDLGSFTNANFGTNGTGNGNITVSWFDPNANGVTVPDGTVLYSLTFEVLSTNSSTIAFTGSPTSIEIINGNSQNVTFIPQNGTVNSGGGGGGGGGGGNPPVNGFAIIASDHEVPTGTNFCVEISVNEFIDILSVQYSMNWDETKFQYTGLGNFGLPDMSVGGNFGTTMTNNGILTFSWLDQSTEGVTLNDGDIIYEVCFDAIGPNSCGNSTQFEFTGTPTAIEVIDANSNEVPFQGIAGDLTICGGPTPGALTFTAEDVTGATGTQVCVPFTVDNFDCIVSAQFSIHFNQNHIQFVSIQNLNLPDLTVGGNFGTGGAGSGTVTFSWFDGSTEGVSVPDGTTIFELCFNVLGANGTTSNITFNGTPTGIEVVDCNSQTVQPEFDPGVVTVQNAAPCGGAVVISSSNITNVSCNGLSNGGVNIEVSGGNNTFTYVWENAAGTNIGSTQDLSGLGAGEYCVTVSSCAGSEVVNACYTVTQPTAINITRTVTNPACFGDSSGAIDLSVSGGATSGGGCTGYTYLWSHQNATTQDITGLPAGNYTVTVTDCNSCTATAGPISVVGPPSELVATANATPVTCFGECDGSINASASSGGVGPYQYRLTGNGVNTGFVSSPTFNNLSLCAGSYFMSVRDAFGCVKTTPVVVTTPTAITASATSTSDTNDCNGSINLTANGGVPPLTYSWTGPNGFTATTQDLNNRCAGEYCVTITDANDCEETLCEQVIAPMSLSPATVQNACFGQNTGVITLNINGGLAPFTYQWTGNLSGGPTVTNVPPGSYTVVVTSADGQTQTMNVTVGQAASAVSVTLNSNPNLSSPSACDGALAVSGSGGFNGPFTYQWSNGPTTSTANNLCAGSYTVTVTDAGGCTAVGGPYQVAWLPTQLNMGVQANVICGTGSNGQIAIEVTGGLAPYNFTFDGPGANDPAPVSNNTTGQVNLTGLVPGTYTITVTDSAPGTLQQTTNTSATVQVVQMAITPTTIFPVTASDNGQIYINPTGGTIPYTFQWSNASDAQNPTGLLPGIYSLTITDANGCAQAFTNIQVGTFSAASSTNSPDCPDETGSITVNPTGNPNAPFTYVWTNSNGQTVGGNNPTLSGQPVGSYSVTITDTLGIEIVRTFNLTSVSNLSGGVSVISDFNGFDVRCHGGSSGVAQVNVTDGVAPFTYLWSNNTVGLTANGLSAGPISVTVTDEEGCDLVLTANVTQPPDLIINAETGRQDCGENEGWATANPTGGITPYKYFWNDDLNQTARTAILLDGGTYNVTVEDANGCFESAIVAVPDFTPLIAYGTAEPDLGGPDGKAIVVVTSGTPPYEFEWRDYIVTDSILTELLPGTYFVKVTDAAGCEVLIPVKVDDGTVCLDALTVITPEGDGFNEEFKIGCLSRYNDNSLEIYNRWGQLVYATDNYSDADLWRGTTRRGDDVPDGVYFYVFEYLDPVSGLRESKKGSVSVLRK